MDHVASPRRLEWTDALIVVASELLFIALPLVVISIVEFHHNGGWTALFNSSEWSFAAAVLFGQAVVKMISVAAGGAIKERATFFGALTMVFGLVPSLVVLALILIDKTPTTGLRFAQIALFLLGVLVYTWFAAGSHLLPQHEHANARLPQSKGE
ncbi:MAG: hypothetical protein QOE82_1754 [Thermoanaerobaculia bacterium]|jgi:hypothetical protein|nr:hypothetical protein [Thermoanaerobaculia bacterium]